MTCAYTHFFKPKEPKHIFVNPTVKTVYSSLHFSLMYSFTNRGQSHTGFKTAVILLKRHNLKCLDWPNFTQIVCHWGLRTCNVRKHWSAIYEKKWAQWGTQNLTGSVVFAFPTGQSIQLWFSLDCDETQGFRNRTLFNLGSSESITPDLGCRKWLVLFVCPTMKGIGFFKHKGSFSLMWFHSSCNCSHKILVGIHGLLIRVYC